MPAVGKWSRETVCLYPRSHLEIGNWPRGEIHRTRRGEGGRSTAHEYRRKSIQRQSQFLVSMHVTPF